MQKIKVVQIGSQSFTLKELPMVAIRGLINNGVEGKSTDLRFHTLLKLACPELTEEVLFDPEQPMYPSEIEELWNAFEEVNSAFLDKVRLIGLDQVLIEAVGGAVRSSIGQFASSLPPVTVPASGITDTVSS